MIHGGTEQAGGPVPAASATSATALASSVEPWLARLGGRSRGNDRGTSAGTTVELRAQPRVRVPVWTRVGSAPVGRGALPGAYEVVLVQRQPSGEIGGSGTLALTIAKQ